MSVPFAPPRPIDLLFAAGLARRVGPSAALVYGYLASTLDAAGEVSIQPEAVRTATGLSRATTYRALDRLAVAGLLERLPSKSTAPTRRAILWPPDAATCLVSGPETKRRD